MSHHRDAGLINLPVAISEDGYVPADRHNDVVLLAAKLFQENVQLRQQITSTQERADRESLAHRRQKGELQTELERVTDQLRKREQFEIRNRNLEILIAQLRDQMANLSGENETLQNEITRLKEDKSTKRSTEPKQSKSAPVASQEPVSAPSATGASQLSLDAKKKIESASLMIKRLLEQISEAKNELADTVEDLNVAQTARVKLQQRVSDLEGRLSRARIVVRALRAQSYKQVAKQLAQAGYISKTMLRSVRNAGTLVRGKEEEEEDVAESEGIDVDDELLSRAVRSSKATASKAISSSTSPASASRTATPTRSRNGVRTATLSDVSDEDGMDTIVEPEADESTEEVGHRHVRDIRVKKKLPASTPTPISASTPVLKSTIPSHTRASPATGGAQRAPTRKRKAADGTVSEVEALPSDEVTATHLRSGARARRVGGRGKEAGETREEEEGQEEEEQGVSTYAHARARPMSLPVDLHEALRLLLSASTSPHTSSTTDNAGDADTTAAAGEDATAAALMDAVDILSVAIARGEAPFTFPTSSTSASSTSTTTTPTPAIVPASALLAVLPACDWVRYGLTDVDAPSDGLTQTCKNAVCTHAEWLARAAMGASSAAAIIHCLVNAADAVAAVDAAEAAAHATNTSPAVTADAVIGTSTGSAKSVGSAWLERELLGLSAPQPSSLTSQASLLLCIALLALVAPDAVLSTLRSAADALSPALLAAMALCASPVLCEYNSLVTPYTPSMALDRLAAAVSRTSSSKTDRAHAMEDTEAYGMSPRRLQWLWGRQVYLSVGTPIALGAAIPQATCSCTSTAVDADCASCGRKVCMVARDALWSSWTSDVMTVERIAGNERLRLFVDAFQETLETEEGSEQHTALLQTLAHITIQAPWQWCMIVLQRICVPLFSLLPDNKHTVSLLRIAQLMIPQLIPQAALGGPALNSLDSVRALCSAILNAHSPQASVEVQTAAYELMSTASGSMKPNVVQLTWLFKSAIQDVVYSCDMATLGTTYRINPS